MPFATYTLSDDTCIFIPIEHDPEDMMSGALAPEECSLSDWRYQDINQDRYLPLISTHSRRFN